MPNAAYDKQLSARKLQELGVQNKFCRGVLEQFDDSFTMDELRRVLPARFERPDARDWPLARTASVSQRIRARRLRAKRLFTPAAPSCTTTRLSPLRDE